ncbi:chloromuconate cycloisomerase [Halobellus salinus]|uniref:o-succinylbenzoate synthase n=1 Tax=Halobellus salinus TaxID=931585 RepID=A0A830ELU6_9EURY|nr:enolase C-terminal domain-like protein [Halobellus salinus]GGJ03528.1 chloromuconate cycloisomerase [Halobellus salinus]SMP21253.1 o-succinylbenzoate synthase [Halobellus salinus]
MIRYDAFSLRLSSPLGTAAGRIEERRGFVVRVESDGHRGVGEAAPLPGWTESYDDCEAALSGAAGGSGVGNSAITDPIDRIDGTTPAARHGVELAWADARAQAAGKSLAAWLADGSPAESVPVNATVGDATVEATAEATRAAVEAGYEAVKLKVGAREPDADAARLRAARDAAGDGVALRADANGAWDRPTAERLIDLAADLGFAYVEQPRPASDLAGNAAVRGRGVDIAVDESVATAGVDATLAADAADVVVCKPMALGGPVRTCELARRASARGVDTVVTTTIDGVVARTGALHVAAALSDVRACGLATGGRLASDLASDPAPVDTGRMAVPAGPGLAGSFDPLR